MTDFNDLHQSKGTKAVQELIERAKLISPINSVINSQNAAVKAPPKPPEAILTKASTLTPMEVKWLIDGYLALGKFHILAGAPGVGKTTLMMSIAAMVTNGINWLDGSEIQSSNVVVWTGEDGLEDTLLPRFLSMGGDPDKLHFITGILEDEKKKEFDPAEHMTAVLDTCLKLPKIGLIIIDPCSTTVAGDSHKNTETRRGLQPLVDMAEYLNCAVLGITHFSKGKAGGDPTQKVIGSVAFAAVARVVLVAAKTIDENGNETRVLCRSKSNIGSDSGGFYYQVEEVFLEKYPDVKTTKILWGSEVSGNAFSLLKETENTEDGITALDEAKIFLKEQLKEGLMPSVEVFKQAKDAGISKTTLHKAKRALLIKPIKSGMEGGWYWKLPEKIIVEGAHGATKVVMPIEGVPSVNDEYLQKKIATREDLNSIYLSHHTKCLICIAAGQKRGSRCEEGTRLWSEYENFSN